MNAIYKSDAAGHAVREKYREVLGAWPVPARQFTVPTRAGDTFVVACGPEGAPPLLLFHGSQANSSVYMFDILSWSRRFRVYAIDMIGEPGLSAPSRPPLDGEAHALWLDDVIAALGLDQVMIVGMSLGGWLALDHAARRPGRVTRLALLCPAGIGRQKNFLLKVLPLLLLGPWGVRKTREMVMGPVREVAPEARPLVDLVQLIGRSARPRMVQIPRLSDDELGKLPPTLVIAGGRDVLIDSGDTCRRLARFAPSACVKFDPDARHYIPDQAATILAFLEEGIARPA
ncbi:alpha/beta fold hydrolase [Phreatobacter stygius]|uniref:Alpha/beta hydrolase n=1 Tax=Phreatobacter stygius TaxID=1940610 RepID=A0A4D7B4W1_9HYPH|nr:alpha/beta hydrolase [Phreatobacter stygius]QCI67991.1 alpha/beta hydrolase [Phreatobacter stygius]